MSEYPHEQESPRAGDPPATSGGGKRIKRHLNLEPEVTPVEAPEVAEAPAGAVSQDDREFWNAIFEQAEQSAEDLEAEQERLSEQARLSAQVRAAEVARMVEEARSLGAARLAEEARSAEEARLAARAAAAQAAAAQAAVAQTAADQAEQDRLAQIARASARKHTPAPSPAELPTEPVVPVHAKRALPHAADLGAANGLPGADVAAFQNLFTQVQAQQGDRETHGSSEPELPDTAPASAPSESTEVFSFTGPGGGGNGGDGGDGGDGDGGDGDGGSTHQGPGHVDDGGGRRRRKKSRLPGCLVALAVLAMFAGGLYLVVDKGQAWLSDQFNGVDDYPGPGTGEVMFEVASGDTAAQMGRNLKKEDVVKSVQAFINAAAADDRSGSIQVGFYSLRSQMSAGDVVAVLVDPANRVSNRLTIPEGLRVVDVVDTMASKTDFKRKDIEAALKDGAALGLPKWAGGNPEGYLFPATYEIGPKDTAASVLKAMVTRWHQAAEEADLEGRAEELGYTPKELMIVASLVQAEGRGDDMPKIARVIFNRIENPNNGVTNGLVQVDASVNYGLGEKGIARLTQAQIDGSDSPYNLYRNKGLPPTPINSPGDAAIEAATHPATGDWLFYVTVNLKTAETKFAESYDEFLSLKRELDSYCANESDAC